MYAVCGDVGSELEEYYGWVELAVDDAGSFCCASEPGYGSSRSCYPPPSLPPPPLKLKVMFPLPLTMSVVLNALFPSEAKFPRSIPWLLSSSCTAALATAPLVMAA